MIDISYEKNPELYFDYRKGLELLSSLNFDDYEFVIVDEAYGDYCDKSYLKENIKNVIITKTFSKSISIPGIRFAYCVGESSIIDKMKFISHKYSINGVVQSILPDAFNLITPHISRMLKTKDYLMNEYECLPSYANFVRPIKRLPYDIEVQKIDNFYRFTLTDMETLNDFLIKT